MDGEGLNHAAKNSDRYGQVVQATVCLDDGDRQFRVLRVVDNGRLSRLDWEITTLKDGRREVREYGQANVNAPQPEDFVR